jgi:hypothetical protein
MNIMTTIGENVMKFGSGEYEREVERKIGTPLSNDEKRMINEALDNRYKKIDPLLNTYLHEIKNHNPPECGMETQVQVIVYANPGTELNGMWEGPGSFKLYNPEGNYSMYTGSPSIRGLLDIIKNEGVRWVHKSRQLKTCQEF